MPAQPQHLDLSLRRFDPSGMPDDAVVMVIGKRNTGKSVLARDILYHKRHIPYGVVISPTERANSFFKGFVPDLYIYHEFHPQIVENLLRQQERQIQRVGRDAADAAFLVLDDCMFDKNFLNSKCVRELLMNGRHYKVFVIVTAQYCGDINPSTRGNIDYCFVMRDPIILNRRKLYENFFGLMPKFRDFCDLMDRTTENYETLIVDNRCASNKLSHALAYYRADPRKTQFRMGSPAYWRMHQSQYDPRARKAPAFAAEPGRIKITKRR